MKAVSSQFFQACFIKKAFQQRAASIVMMAFVAGSALPVYAEGSVEAGVEAASAAAAAPAKKQVLAKSATVSSMPTRIMHKSVLQDIVRVGEKLFIAGERGHIGWSDDNGKNWQQARVPTIADITALYFVTQELGWAVGHDGNIFNTVDGGKTWAMQLDGIEYNLRRAQSKVDRYTEQLTQKQTELEAAELALEDAQEAKKKNVDKLQEAVDTLQEVVDELDFQVRDARKILEEENAPWPLMDVWFSDINNGYVVGAFNAFLMTADGGKTWTDASTRLENPDGLHLNLVTGQGSMVLIGGEGGLLFRSSDAGANWAALESPSEGSFYAMHVSPTEKPAALDIWATGIQGFLYHSTDSGSTWTQVEHAIGNNLNALCVDGNGLILIVGNDGAILRSTDAGKTFEAQHRADQVTMSGVVVAADGNYIFTGVTGVTIFKPSEWKSTK